MMKTITVKGVGSVSAKPDYVVLSLFLKAADKNYETAMEMAAKKINELNRALTEIGFENDSVKTADFDVRTVYGSRKDHNGNYHRFFDGYEVNHRLKVSFDFDSKLLSMALSTIASCVAMPELSISFTVKDTSAANEYLLKSAAENARKKAEILCAASNADLGELLSIDYNWGELDIYSPTRYELDEKCMSMAPTHSIDIEPDDIRLSDTVTFVWNIR